MGVVLSAFPDQPQVVQTVTLGDRQFRVEMTWRRRCRAWYVSLLTGDEVPLAMGRRLSPGWSPLAGIILDEALAPDGLFVVRGVDGYAREDLGEALTVAFYTSAELAAAKAAADAEDAADGVEDPLALTVILS